MLKLNRSVTRWLTALGVSALILIGFAPSALASGSQLPGGTSLFGLEDTGSAIALVQLDATTGSTIQTLNSNILPTGSTYYQPAALPGSNFVYLYDGAKQLHRIDVVAGTSSVIGTSTTSVNALAIDANGQAIATDGYDIFTVDLSTGQATDTMQYIGGSQLISMTFAADGALYGIRSTSSFVRLSNPTTSIVVQDLGLATAAVQTTNLMTSMQIDSSGLIWTIQGTSNPATATTLASSALSAQVSASSTASPIVSGQTTGLTRLIILWADPNYVAPTPSPTSTSAAADTLAATGTDATALLGAAAVLALLAGSAVRRRSS